MELQFFYFDLPPTEDELPSDDGVPMETLRHRLQMNLLIEPIELAWADRDDFFVSGNMFVYFRLNQVMDYDFRGPDFFAVLGVPKRERKSWVVWQEGKGPAGHAKSSGRTGERHCRPPRFPPATPRSQ